MQIELNARGNGACPLCASFGNCQIQETLVQTMDAFSGDMMELVIYSCPYFNEKD
jgi:hypothetical protein